MPSASVIVKELDLSTRVPTFPGVYGAIVIPAAKGPINTPVLCTNESDLLNTFTPNGKVDVGMDLSYFSALAYLQQSDKLWVVRAANGALYGGAVIKSGTTSASAPIPSGIANPEAFAFDSSTVAGVQQVAEVKVAAGDTSGSLNNKYFTFSAPDSSGASVLHAVWFNVGALGTTPSVPGATLVAVNITANASATAVASAIATTLQGPLWTSVSSDDTVTITNVSPGLVAAPTAGNTGWSASDISIKTAGVNPDNSTDCFLIYGANQGAWANNVAVKITSFSEFPEVVKEPNSFLIEVFAGPNFVTPVESWICSRDPSHMNGYNQNIYLEKVLEGSSYIRAIDNLGVGPNTLPKSTPSVVHLDRGSDGVLISDSHMIAASQVLTNTDQYTISLFLDGGWSTPAYQSNLDTICRNRKDCIAVLSVPYSSESSASYLSDIRDYRNSTLNLNSSYSALYSPHVKIYDKYNDRYLFASPDGYAAAAISASASNFEIWYPPAGFTRGVVNVLDLRRRFNKAEMDALYDSGINPLRFAPGKGILIWGQKTLQSRPSSLQRLNVRLLLNYIEPAIKAVLEGFLFEINNSTTQSLATALLVSYMDNIKARQGVSAYSVVCNSKNNTPADIDAGRMNVWLYVIPVGSVEEIPFTVIITRNGVSFG